MTTQKTVCRHYGLPVFELWNGEHWAIAVTREEARKAAISAAEAAKASGFQPRSANYTEVFLRHFFDNPNLQLVCVMAAFNPSNGHDYYVYGHKS